MLRMKKVLKGIIRGLDHIVNFIVWLIKKMMNIQLDRGAGFISTF